MKRSRPTARPQSRLRRLPEPTLAQRLGEVDEAVKRRDYGALLDLADRSMEQITRVIQEIIADQHQSLKKMAKIEKRIDHTQAETARILDRLVNGH
jgi:hypothetical protein